MHVLYICSEYPPRKNGGIGTFTQSAARFLAASDVKASVIGLYSDLKEAESFLDQGVRVNLIPRSQWGWVCDRVKFFKAVKSLCHREKISLIETPDFEGACAFWSSLKIPFVSRLHGSTSYFSNEMKSPINKTTYFLEKNSLANSRAWVSTSAYTLKKTKELFKMKPPHERVVHNFVEIDDTVDFTSRNAESIIYTGTLIEKKGVFPLMKAWRIVHQKNPKLRLHLFGKDTTNSQGESAKEKMLSLLGAEATASVSFHGHVPREEIKKALNTSAIAVFPSYAEAFALAPLEAMSRGCATIYTVLGSGPEVIANGVDGVLIDPDNSEELAQTILDLQTQKERRLSLAQAGVEKIKKNFSPKVVMQKNIDFYRSIS